MLAEKGKKVVFADFDPQCNLTGLILDYSTAQDLESLYNDKPSCNVKAGLSPAFESRPEPMEAIDCIKIEGTENLFLLPGHMGISEYETILGVAQDFSGALQTFQNLPGSLSHLLNITAEKFDADYVLIDSSPSLGPLNRNLVMTSDYFLIPTNPDFFSLMAIDNLTQVLPQWKNWSQQLSKLEIFSEAAYPFPSCNPKFLGTIIQNYNRRIGDEASQAVQKWVVRLEKKVATKLSDTLQKYDFLLMEKLYAETKSYEEKYTLSKIPDFSTLISKTFEHNTPIFKLTSQQMATKSGYTGPNMIEGRQRYREIIENLTDKILKLTQDA